MLSQIQSLSRPFLFLDVLLTAIAFLSAYLAEIIIFPGFIRDAGFHPEYGITLLLAVIIWYLVLKHSFVYTFYVSSPHLKGCIYNLIKSIALCAFILLFFLYFFNLREISRLTLLLFIVLNVTLLVAYRYLVYRFSDFFFRKKYLRFNILLVVIGSKTAARELTEKIQQEASRIKILGCVDIDKKRIGLEITDGIKVIGTLENLDNILVENAVDELIFAMPVDEIVDVEHYLAFAETLGIKVRILPHWHLRRILSSRPDHYYMGYEEFFREPTFLLTPAPGKKWSLSIKTAVDYVLASVMLLFLLPVMAAIALSVKLFSPGPVFFKQKRCGLYGRVFTMYKFRTMVNDAEMMSYEMTRLNESMGPVFKIKDDPRIIPYIGKFLRRSALDELPQLYNVLRGEMSLVGPRPPIPEEIKNYELWQRRRLSMKPGLTCLWQITPDRNDVDFEQWMRMDLEYIDNWSLTLDLKILLKTVRAVLTGSGR